MPAPLIAAAILSGLIGYAIGKNGELVPVSQEQVNAMLRDQKPEFLKTINIDTSEARTGDEGSGKYDISGSFILVLNPTTPTEPVYIKLNEPEWPALPLTDLRRVIGPFYRFFIKNEAGTGTLNLIVAKGYQFQFIEGRLDTVMSMTLDDLSNVAATTPSDEDILLYDTTTSHWLNGVLTDIAMFASHKARHQDGGDDELSLAGLAGEPATLTTHKALTTGVHGVGAGAIVGTTLTQTLTNKTWVHKTTHQDGGTDEISLTGLSGEPADVVAKSLFDANTILYAASDNTPEAKTRAELIALLSGQAGGAFDWNGQSLTNIGAVTIGGALTVNAPVTLTSSLNLAGALTGVAGSFSGGLGVAGLTNLQQTLIHSTLGVAGLASFVEVFIGNNITIGGTVDGVNVSDHKTRHQDGGGDEISIAGLAGSPAQKAAASGLASLNASTKVVEQPASITDHLDGSPDEDDATKAPTCEWAFDHKADVSAHHAKYTDAEALTAVAGTTQPVNSKGNSFATIQAAIDDLAGDGWVYVPTGTYNEALTISNNNVTLFGAGWSTIIDGGTSGHAVAVTGASCVVRDLTVKTTKGQENAYKAIFSSTGTADILIFNVFVDGSDDDGIDVELSPRSRIVSCYVYNTDNYGIHLSSSINSIAANNVINTTGDDGILIDADAENCVVDGNRIKGWTGEAIDDDSGTSTIGDNDTA